MKPSKRELWREVEQLKESQKNRIQTNLSWENTDKDEVNDEETYEELAKMADDLF